MKILAIETSVRAWGVALLDGESIVAQPEVDATKPISRLLLPTIRTAIAKVGWDIRTLDLISVTQGPGAFTGLRVGITAAKTLAYALKCSLVASSSLELIAAKTANAGRWQLDQSIRVVMDAQRAEFFVGHFRTLGAWRLEAIGSPSILNSSDLISTMGSGDILTGPALVGWTPPHSVSIADASLWMPDAAVLGRLGLHQIRHGEPLDPFVLTPEYYRPSYAEEKRPSPS